MTMLRAMSLARSRSFWAPVETSSKTISSAQRAGQQHLDAAFQFALRHQVAIALGPLHRVAQRRQAAGNDRDFVHRIGVGQAVGHQGVAALVIGDAQLFVLVDDPLLLFQAGGDAFDAFVELGHADGRFAFAGGQQRRFVDQVGQIGADEAGGDGRRLLAG